MNIDLASVTRARAVVLVEGMSDKAALEVLAERRGQMPSSGGIFVVAMGGAAGASRFLDLLGPHGIGARVAGLCDAGADFPEAARTATAKLRRAASPVHGNPIRPEEAIRAPSRRRA